MSGATGYTQGNPVALYDPYGRAIGPANGLSTTDTNGGAAPAGASAPTNPGSGFLGWLGGIYAQLGRTLTVQNPTGIALSTTDTNGGAAPTGTGAPINPGTGILGWLAGAYTQLGSIVTTLAGTLKVADGNNASYSFWPTIAASSGGSGNPPAGTYTPPAGTRAIGVSCTAAATIQMTDGAGNVQPWQIAVGSSILPFMPASFTLSSGAATFFGDR